MAETATIASDSTGREGTWPAFSESTGGPRSPVPGSGAFRTTTASILLATVFSIPTTIVMDEVISDRILNLNQATTTLPDFGSARITETAALTPSYMLAFFRSAFGLNMSETAQVFLVERPTVYSWLAGARPRPANLGRLLNLHTLALQYSHLPEPVAELVGARRGVLLQLLEGRNPSRSEINHLLSGGIRLEAQTSVREWAHRRNISLDALRNLEAEVPDHPLTLDEDE